MTHTTVDVEPQSVGSLEGFVHTIDITSLDAAGQENYDPATAVGVGSGPNRGVFVVGQEDATKVFSWDHTSDHLDVVNVSDAADVSNNTDCGEVRLFVVGL